MLRHAPLKMNATWQFQAVWAIYRKSRTWTFSIRNPLSLHRRILHFPHDAIAAETTANTEMTLMVDLDLDLLKELRQQGSVRNLKSRRKELYEIVWKSEKD